MRPLRVGRLWSERGCRRTLMRVGACGCVALAAAAWFGLPVAAASTNVGPEKTAWYDNTGAQEVTGVTTPSAAKSGELEVSYVPVSAQEPQQTVPTAPSVPGAPVSPPSGQAGGGTAGGTLAFAAVEYAVPLESQGQSVDPSSIQATLSLQLDPSSSTPVSTGDLLACPTANPLWSAGPDQDSSAAPAYTCGPGQAVTGNVSGTTVTFALGPQQESSLEPGVFSVVIVPGTSPSGAFQAVIEPPGAASLAVDSEAPLSNTDLNLAGVSGAPAPAESSGTASNFASTPYAPTATSPASSVSGAPAPAAPEGSAQSPSGVTSREASGVPVASHGGVDANIQRTIAVMLLLALAGLLAIGSSREVRPPRSLRGLSADAA